MVANIVIQFHHLCTYMAGGLDICSKVGGRLGAATAFLGRWSLFVTVLAAEFHFRCCFFPTFLVTHDSFDGN
jgi:hypothetical protein